MIFTEKESHKHECRMLPPVIFPTQSLQGTQMNIQVLNCSGPNCMAWRWSVHTKIEDSMEQKVGFCGLVRSPPMLADLGLGSDPINADATLVALDPDKEPRQ